MSDQIILQLIITISQFCSYQPAPVTCTKQIWSCGHNVTNSIIIVTETHNCITKYLKGKL